MDVELVIDSRDALARHFVADLAREIRAAGAPGRRTLAVPGGSVAHAFLPALVDAPVDWSSLDLFWTDERAVEPTSPDSNFALARELWLDRVDARAMGVHRMRAELADLQASAERYAAELRAAAGDPPRLDYVLSGVGADGHVASIFPGADRARYLAAPDVGFIEDAPAEPPRRMTIGMAALARARRVTVAAFGASKAGAIAAALREGDASPLGVLLASTGRPLLLLDPEAASRVGDRS